MKVLIIRLSSLGDIVQTFEAIDLLCAYPEIEVHFLTKEKFKDGVSLHGGIFKIHTIPNHCSLRQLNEIIKTLREFDFSAICDLHRNLRSKIILRGLRVPYIQVQKHRFKEWLLFTFHRKIFQFLGFKPLNRVSEAKMAASRLVAKLGFAEQQPVLLNRRIPELNPTISQWIQAQNSNGFICICVESAWVQKRWPFAKFLEVAQCVRARNVGICWVGQEKITDLSSFDLNLTGQISLGQLSSVFAQARVLICNDSGTMHLAEAVGTPVVSIFGPTSVELGFAPKLTNSKVIQNKLWCQPCSKTGRWCIRPVDRWKCLNNLEASQVIEQVEAML